MAKKTESAALATTASTALAPAGSSDLLADVLGEGNSFATDGLEEIDSSDIKLATYVWNFKGTDAEGEPFSPTVFYDTVLETGQKTVDAVLLTLHKSNEFREFVNEENKSYVRCRSFDRVTGRMENGTERPCAGCPDAEWRMDDKGKRVRNCGPVYNVVGLDRVKQSAFVIRCKKTSLDPLKSYLNKHFLGKRVVGGKRGNYPLFAFATKLSLRMSDDKKYSIPVFERGDVLSREEMVQASADATFYREHMLPALEKAEKADVDGEPKTDTSFNPSEFMDTSGGDVSPAPASGPNLF